MFTIEISEIQHLRQHSNAKIGEVLYLLEDAYHTIADALSQSIEADGRAVSGVVIDNEFIPFVVTAYASANTAIQPHIIEIDGVMYNAEYAVRVLACYLASVEFVRFAERVIRLEEIG